MGKHSQAFLSTFGHVGAAGWILISRLSLEGYTGDILLARSVPIGVKGLYREYNTLFLISMFV